MFGGRYRSNAPVRSGYRKFGSPSRVGSPNARTSSARDVLQSSDGRLYRQTSSTAGTKVRSLSYLVHLHENTAGNPMPGAPPRTARMARKAPSVRADGS